MEGHCSTGQSLQWAVVPMEEEEKEEENLSNRCTLILSVPFRTLRSRQ
jgi:hypothetical protein